MIQQTINVRQIIMCVTLLEIEIYIITFNLKESRLPVLHMATQSTLLQTAIWENEIIGKTRLVTYVCKHK